MWYGGICRLQAGLDGVDFAADSASIDAALVRYAHDRNLKFGVWKCPWHEEDAHLWSYMAGAGVIVVMVCTQIAVYLRHTRAHVRVATERV